MKTETNCKYLKDGRKVVVVGKLNNEESIVQEIFVTEANDEIPGGERFTTKSLFDEPVESYASKALKRREEQATRMEADIKKLEQETKVAKWKLRDARKLMSSVLKSIKGLEADPSQLDLLSLFLSGSAKWVAELTYGIEPPKRFMEAIEGHKDRWERDEIKLLTVGGESDGDLVFRIDQYGDGSGGCGRKIYFFETKKEAIACIADHARSKLDKLGQGDLQKCLKMGIKFTNKEMAGMLERFRATVAKSTEKIESDRKKALEREAKTLKEIEQLSK